MTPSSSGCGDSSDPPSWATSRAPASRRPTPTAASTSRGWTGPAPGGFVLMTPNGQRRLLGHPYNTTSDYTFFSFAKLSPDGRYVLFTSDMNGSARSDLFLAEVPTGAGDSNPPTVVITAPLPA